MNDKVKQNTWRIHKDDHKTEGFKLDDIFEIDLPFWQCKQNVVVEKDVEIDRFSFIILKLVDSGMTKYSEICAFLGIDEDSFVNIQFNYLLKNDFLREIDNDTLAITLDGKSFMNKDAKVKHTETEEFEFLMHDKFVFLKNDLSGTFFDPSKPIDKNWSYGKKQDFSGYNIIQSHKKQTKDDVKEIEHQNKPTYKLLTESRSSFAEFYNSQCQEKTFYDFANSNFQQFKRNIRFLGLLYRNKKNESDIMIDILQYNQTVNKFDGKYNGENSLSKLVTNYYQKHFEDLKKN